MATSKRVNAQAKFLSDLVTFLKWIEMYHPWLVVTGDELKRTEYQQKEYKRLGKSLTMDSAHRDRRAADLCFYNSETGEYYEPGKKTKEILDIIGRKWVSMDPKNRWGGNFKYKNGDPFYDTPHFERQK